jgi:hypothetical protein
MQWHFMNSMRIFCVPVSIILAIYVAAFSELCLVRIKLKFWKSWTIIYIYIYICCMKSLFTHSLYQFRSEPQLWHLCRMPAWVDLLYEVKIRLALWRCRTFKRHLPVCSRGKGFFCSLCVQTGSEVHPASFPVGTGGPFSRGNADHIGLLQPSSAEVRMSRSYISFPTSVFMMCSGTALLFAVQHFKYWALLIQYLVKLLLTRMQNFTVQHGCPCWRISYFVILWEILWRQYETQFL